jgi:aerobic-type carbon monoxide dehydrogenase small subunit (CoxS/CutS family)
MSETITVFVNGNPVSVQPGTTAAIAVMQAGESAFRTSVTGEGRGPLCGMGICFECRLTINGQPHRRSCQVACQDGMDMRTDDHAK